MDVVYALSSATVSHEGAQVPVRKGQHWYAADPLVLAFPHLFSRDARYGMRYTRHPEDLFDEAPGGPVELATAAPGEKRSVRRPSA